MKSFLSKGMRRVRGGCKKAIAALLSPLFGRYCYPLFGLPGGITQIEEVEEHIPTTSYKVAPLPEPQSYRHEKFAAKELVFDGSRSYLLRGGMATATGGHLDRKGKLITTYLTLAGGNEVKSHELFYVSSSRFFPKILEVDKKVLSLVASWQGAFYHWMWQIIPKLHLLRDQLLYVDQTHSFQRETLQLLGQKDVIDASFYDAVKSPEILVPSTPAAPTSYAAQFLRSSFLPLLKKGKEKRLFISRADAKTRRLRNEEEIFALLEPLGFTKVTLSGRSLAEQMSLFASAECIISPHGAALAHLAFCSPQTRVIELFHKNYVNTCYWQIASLLSLSYIPLFDTEERSEEDPDITLDPQLVRRALDHTP